MKFPVVHGILLAAFFAATINARAQQIQPDTGGWNARMTALQQEHDAQADVAVSIVFDDSGSMNDNHKLVMAKRAFRTWIEHAPDNYSFGLVALNAGVLVPLQRNDRDKILAAVSRLEAGGDTPLAKTIAGAAADVYRRRAAGAVYERQVVVILTDGEDTTNRGIKGVQEEIRRLCANRVEVIAFGYQGEGDYMRNSATHFYSPDNGEDISRGLNAIGSEIGDTSDVVVDDATRAAMLNVSTAASAPDSTPAATPTPKASRPFSPGAAASPSPAKPASRTHPVSTSSGWKWLVLLAIFAVIRARGKRR